MPTASPSTTLPTPTPSSIELPFTVVKQFLALLETTPSVESAVGDYLDAYTDSYSDAEIEKLVPKLLGLARFAGYDFDDL